MKTFLLLPLVLAVPAFAGTSAKETIAPAPAPNPCLLSWFAGGSVGYLTELEEPMYNAHIGLTNSCWVLGGFNVSTFLEVGYTQTDEDFNSHRREIGTIGDRSLSPKWGNGDSFSIDDMADALQFVSDYTGYDTSYDLQIMPITMNVKFERAITGNLNGYFGGGLGIAWVDLDLDLGPMGDYSDSDWVFTAQIFAGLSYNFTPNFEVYGGGRWIYLQDPDFSDGGGSATLDLDNDWLLELGLRFKF
jgi:opacity protein-like surface antigen